MTMPNTYLATYRIFQIDLYPHREAIQAAGWDVDREVPAFHAWSTLSRRGAAGYQPWMREHFTRVGFVDARDLEHAFAILNGAAEGFIQREAERMRSLSVGDVLTDDDSGEAWIVEPFGFKKLDFPD